MSDAHEAYRNSEPGKAWNDAYAAERRCRWPVCDCYAPQGPQVCRRALAGPVDNGDSGE